ncbi:bifunctional helix-turn-helix transcriptional regulator/GNAT family N-acetyltransferase [Tenacibaculum sp. IB213877]|uniref:bifunctional helix-turn-helix transcriptional regulator/GNAT family N-acetyltransferase n=1 Tax=Tenacibaculum sp. IB213877 TaxID=3097351 RepID=UPI002A5A803C|nr:bifunctional helix-turn-helix transcriptional regulator/GNAT family N-acetyltransferase [Tenacibaculum sp. IB213877]MDY0780251.1 bifunctional helix-turn-helix transcriptional regulator/GNAT family N-acetyltransferase [Tenacibaculum sp. IB213877]
MDYDEIGEMALGSRLRALSNLVTEDAQQIYQLYNVDLKPKWFPVFYYLSNHKEAKPITIIANEIGHSHPSVIKIVKEMSKAGLVEEKKDEYDGRKNNISLTQKGIKVSTQIQEQYSDVEQTIKNILSKTKNNLWFAIQEFEYLLGQKSLYERVLEEKKKRESANIKILEYLPEHHSAFKQLNEEWIKTYFKIEEADRKALDNPQEYILNNGGKILVAVENNEILGVCALIKMNDIDYDYELAKMAVSPKARGKGIGYLLGKSIIEKAKFLGAKSLYLESNTILKPAIALYNKLGFKKIVGHSTPYERCNIQMELKL